MEAIAQININDIITTCVTISALYAIFQGAKIGLSNFCKTFGIEFSWVRKQREEHELLLTTAQGLKALTNKESVDVKTFQDTQQKLFESIEDMSTKLTEFKEATNKRFEASEKKQNERGQSELKDKIGQSYRYYHSVGKINDMELEALEGLISAYESYGGNNSFVHSVVQKEMYTWEKVERK